MLHPGRWSLSPAYDLNSVPELDRVHMSKTAITEYQEGPTISAADCFDLKPMLRGQGLSEIEMRPRRRKSWKKFLSIRLPFAKTSD
jgi:hypothetical protein